MSTMGRYEVRDRLGRGGFATVFRGWDPMLKREVALKALSLDWSEDEDVRRRFVQEAQALASVRHEHIVTVYDVGETPERPFFVMELLSGRTLEQLLAGGARMDLPEVLAVAAPLADALDTLHAAGLVHRDVKMANVMFTDGGRVVLMDLGIARVLDGPALTSKSVVMLSPEAASPEQIRGQVVGPPTDIYSLGVVIYQMLAGRPPFVGQTAELLHKHVYEPPPPLWEMRPGLPPLVYAVVDEALAKDPARRPKTAGAVAAALRAAIGGSVSVAPQPVPPPSAPSPAPMPQRADPGSAAQSGPPAAVAERQVGRGAASSVETAWARPAENRVRPPRSEPIAGGTIPAPHAPPTVSVPVPVASLGPVLAAAVVWVLGVVAVLVMLRAGTIDESPYPLLVLAPGAILLGLALPTERSTQLALGAGAGIVVATLASAVTAVQGEIGERDTMLAVVILIAVLPAIGGMAAVRVPDRVALGMTAGTALAGVVLLLWVVPRIRNGPISDIDAIAFLMAQAPLVGLPLTRWGGPAARAGMALVLPWLTLLVVLIPTLAVVD